jgi:hypothetical protein
MDIPVPRLRRPHLIERFDCLIEVAEKQMAPAQPVTHRRDQRVARAEPDHLFDVANRRLRPAEIHFRQAEFVERGGIVAVQCDGPLRGNARFAQPVLRAAQHRHRIVRHRMVGAARKDLGEQFFDPRLVVRERLAPSFEHCRRQHGREADPRPHRAWAELQRPLESPLRILQGCRRAWPVKARPAMHHQIACVGIGRAFPPDVPVDVLDELEVQRMGETADDLVLGLGEVLPVGLKPLGPAAAALPANKRGGGNFRRAV